MTGYQSKKAASLDEDGMYLVHHTEPVQESTLQEKDRKRGSIALARSLCYKINGAADDSDDMDGGGYGSVDIAEILSAEVVRLQAALAQPAQRPWVDLTKEDMPDGDNPMFDHEYFIAGMVYAANILMDKNT